jgi:hypothetical protein
MILSNLLNFYFFTYKLEIIITCLTRLCGNKMRLHVLNNWQKNHKNLALVLCCHWETVSREESQHSYWYVNFTRLSEWKVMSRASGGKTQLQMTIYIVICITSCRICGHGLRRDLWDFLLVKKDHILGQCIWEKTWSGWHEPHIHSCLLCWLPNSC